MANKRTPFTLRSGNTTPFKQMGSSPVKIVEQLALGLGQMWIQDKLSKDDEMAAAESAASRGAQFNTPGTGGSRAPDARDLERFTGE